MDWKSRFRIFCSIQYMWKGTDRKMNPCLLCGANAKYKKPVYRDGIIEPVFLCEECKILDGVRYRYSVIEELEK